MATQHRLQVGVIGAGIAGLAAAIALRRAGHDVEIFEKSLFKNETGAAITMCSNADRILSAWGFDFDKAGATPNYQYRMRKSDLSTIYDELYPDNKVYYGYEWFGFHRQDLHEGLRKLAADLCTESEYGNIKLGSEVVDLDAEAGVLTFHNGAKVEKDLLVLADGARCRFGAQVTGQDCSLQKSGRSAFRCLIPFDKIKADEELWALWKDHKPGYYVVSDFSKATFCVTYPCRDNSILNCAVLHTTRPEDVDKNDWNSPSSAEALFEVLPNFHPAWKRLFEKADDIRVYTLGVRGNIDRIVGGKAVLIGDAAHSMSPSHAQGGCMAIEDAAALEVLFRSSTLTLTPTSTSLRELITARLLLFQKVRHPRNTIIKLLSSLVPGHKPPPRDIIRRFYDGPLPPLRGRIYAEPYRDFYNGYDAFKEAEKALRGEEFRYFGELKTVEDGSSFES